MDGAKREVVKEEPDNEEPSGADVFGESSQTKEKNDDYLLIKPEMVKEEEALEAKIDEEEKKEVVPDDELSQEQRYAKLQRLLKESKLYSDYLLEKMQESEKERKDGKVSAKKGKKRSRADENDEDDKPSKKSKRDENRTFGGQVIPEDQPLLVSGGVMRSYQLDGLKWMMNLDQNGINGILGDEMGLGKTIQTISLFANLVELGVRGPFLIVAPLSTVPNWVKEFKKFAPLLPVVLYHGSAQTRAELRQKHLKETKVIKDVFPEPRAVKNVFVTSYEIAINDRGALRNVKWRYIVVDEGHRLKNKNCRLVRELKMYSSANRLLLTGTPLQNNLDELWSLLNFIMPEIFDDVRVFRRWFDAKDLNEAGEDEKARILQQERQGNILHTLHQVLTPFLLRRVKTDVDLNIPPKKELLVYCPMTPTQHEFYSATVNKTMDELLGKGVKSQETEDDTLEADGEETKKRPKRAASASESYKLILDLERRSERNFKNIAETLERLEEERRRQYEPTSAYRGQMESSEIRYTLRNRMMDLRKVTNHPYLIEYPLTEDGIYYLVNDDVIEKSGKMKVLDQLLNALLERGHKVLIFSQMTRMLDIIGDYLHHKDIRFSRLDGSMNFEDRQENIDRFNETDEINVFLLSTRAGGLGINLTAADTCIIFDSDWNPQQDLQAQDRCHRIGQTKPVIVYRFVTAGTIDEKIVERAAAKRKLEKMVIHRNKFKSQDHEGLTKTMEAISPQELLELLNSKDHAAVFERQDGASVFNQNELEELMDRSDLLKDFNDNKENKKNGGRGVKKASVVKKTKSTGHFKVVDTEGGAASSSGLGSLNGKKDE